MMDSADKVLVTGIGAATPLGNTVAEIADNLLAGRSGVHHIDAIDVSHHSCKVAGVMPPLSVPPGWDPVDFAGRSRREQVLLWSAIHSLQESGWWEKRHEVRIGLVLGVGAEWLARWEESAIQAKQAAYQPSEESESYADRLRRALGLRGPVASVAAACASGNVALGQARRWLKLGWVDVCLAGAMDLPITSMGLGGFCNLGALSKRNDDPSAASRPFDRDRDGFVVGEAGTLFTLERADDVRRRNGRAHAEIAGFGAYSDAAHLVIPSSDTSAACKSIQAALYDAGINPERVDYINAHATSTTVGDRFEAQALHSVFGASVKRIAVSSTKSMTGHLLSAAAAFESLACIIALQRQAVPPTINLHHPDPECDLDHVPHQAREQRVKVALNNSFGFGGSNTCLILRAA